MQQRAHVPPIHQEPRLAAVLHQAAALHQLTKLGAALHQRPKPGAALHRRPRPDAVLLLPGAALLLKRRRAAVPLPVNRQDQIAALLELSKHMAMEGRTLIERVLPQPPDTYTQYEHYPKGDAIDPDSRARWFYHAHAPEARGMDEHGHFHMFLPLSAFGDEPALATPRKDGAAKVVHVAALCFNTDGLPTHWIATNQWVTEEFLYPAEAIIARLDRMQMEGAGVSKGIPYIGQWLTLALAIARDDIADMLRARDVALKNTDLRDYNAEILAQCDFTM